MNLRTRFAAVLSTAAIATLIVVGAVPAQAAAPLPTSMAALGDSISQAMNSCGYKNCPANSWSTGTASGVNSQANRLRAAGATGLVATNNSVSGVKAAGLLTQATAAVNQGAQYVTIQIGANDACTSTVGTMTSVDVFREQVRVALVALAASPAAPQIHVSSIPNLKTLWSVSKGKFTARLIWASAKVCQSMLANPTSTKSADNQRRDAVQLRVTEFNAALASVCTAALRCKYDGGAVAGFTFTSSHISTYDYFHPSVAGQAKLAELTWGSSPYVG